MSRIKNNFSYPEINVKTWQDYNKSFYSTLKIEKNMLLVLIALIFVVVAINIFNSMRRLVFELELEMPLKKKKLQFHFGVQKPIFAYY